MSATFSNARIADRISVMVSIVATASYNGVESSTRFTPTSPAFDAASSTTRNSRRGSFEAFNRARMSTSTVCAKLTQPSPS